MTPPGWSITRAFGVHLFQYVVRSAYVAIVSLYTVCMLHSTIKSTSDHHYPHHVHKSPWTSPTDNNLYINTIIGYTYAEIQAIRMPPDDSIMISGQWHVGYGPKWCCLDASIRDIRMPPWSKDKVHKDTGLITALWEVGSRLITTSWAADSGMRHTVHQNATLIATSWADGSDMRHTGQNIAALMPGYWP